MTMKPEKTKNVPTKVLMESEDYKRLREIMQNEINHNNIKFNSANYDSRETNLIDFKTRKIVFTHSEIEKKLLKQAKKDYKKMLLNQQL